MAENAGVFLVPTMQAIREDRAGLAKGTVADYTAAKFPATPSRSSIPTATAAKLLGRKHIGVLEPGRVALNGHLRGTSAHRA